MTAGATRLGYAHDILRFDSDKSFQLESWLGDLKVNLWRSRRTREISAILKGTSA